MSGSEELWVLLSYRRSNRCRSGPLSFRPPVYSLMAQLCTDSSPTCVYVEVLLRHVFVSLNHFVGFFFSSFLKRGKLRDRCVRRAPLKADANPSRHYRPPIQAPGRLDKQVPFSELCLERELCPPCSRWAHGWSKESPLCATHQTDMKSRCPVCYYPAPD